MGQQIYFSLSFPLFLKSIKKKKLQTREDPQKAFPCKDVLRWSVKGFRGFGYFPLTFGSLCTSFILLQWLLQLKVSFGLPWVYGNWMFDVGEVWLSVHYWQVKRGRPEVDHIADEIQYWSLSCLTTHSPTPPCICPPSTFPFCTPLPLRQRYISWKLEKPGTSNLRSVLIKLGYKIQAQLPYLWATPSTFQLGS